MSYDAQMIRLAPYVQMFCAQTIGMSRRGLPSDDIMETIAAFLLLLQGRDFDQVLRLIDDPTFIDSLARMRGMKLPNPKKNAHFLFALRQLPCLRCGKRPAEAAHIRLTSQEWTDRTGVQTGAGGAQKPADRWALPLCAGCHREGPEAEHLVGTKEFYRRWGVDPHLIADDLWRAYPNADAMAGVAARILHFGFGKP